jgi:probable rRNA maturation factor
MIEINNLTNFAVEKKSFSQVAKKVLSGENRRTENISLAFVGKEEIKKLNKEFRKKNKATDVLSFNLDEENYLGEIVICPDIVKEKDEDIMRVFVHGILHLLGYDHEKSKKEALEMEAKEKIYLK